MEVELDPEHQQRMMHGTLPPNYANRSQKGSVSMLHCVVPASCDIVVHPLHRSHWHLQRRWGHFGFCSVPSPLSQSPHSDEEHYLQGENGGGRELRTWDDALLKSTQEFQHRSYSLFTCNCHSFVAHNLNRLGFLSRGWNVVNLAIFILFSGRWVSTASMLRSILPFIFVFSIGVIFGGFTFLKYWFVFTCALIGWFILGTYCFKNLIQL